jgi:hypothetical protein
MTFRGEREEELFTELLSRERERIVSTGQSTPGGSALQPDHDE